MWAQAVRYEEKQRLARTPSLRQRLLKPFSERRYLVIDLEGKKKKIRTTIEPAAVVNSMLPPRVAFCIIYDALCGSGGSED